MDSSHLERFFGDVKFLILNEFNECYIVLNMMFVTVLLREKLQEKVVPHVTNVKGYRKNEDFD